jgi:polyhydroxybutyrate depolymerase
MRWRLISGIGALGLWLVAALIQPHVASATSRPESLSCPPPRQACLIASGEYMAYAPPGWDGKSPLPALVHFHGFRESAADIMARADIRDFAASAGLLLIVPQGAGESWSHPGSPTQRRDEFAFLHDMLADVRQRWPLDDARLWASGFSQGASMVWAIACHRPKFFAGYLAIAGAFWRPEPETCEPGARRILHIHGLQDRTVPLEGRPIRGGAFHQGDVFRAAGVMRRAMACAPFQQRTRRVAALTCEIADGCQNGASFEICLHVGTHDFDPSWLKLGWDWLQKPQ